jgi:hypothetical protein
MNDIEKAYQITKIEIENGLRDIYDYLPILYQMKLDEKYEMMAGIKKAISEYGMQLEIPENKDELNKWMNEIKKSTI